MDVPATRWMDTIASDEVIDLAYAWLCRQRQHHRPESDVWHLRFHWHETSNIEVTHRQPG